MIRTKSKLRTRREIYNAIVRWATERYMPFDASLVGLAQINRMGRIIDLAGAKYLGQREVYRGRPILSCPTLRWKKKPWVPPVYPSLKERKGSRWAYFTASGCLEIVRAETKRDAIVGIEAITGTPPIRDEVWRL